MTDFNDILESIATNPNLQMANIEDKIDNIKDDLSITKQTIAELNGKFASIEKENTRY